MEYNQNQNYQNTQNTQNTQNEHVETPVFLKEKSHNTKIWYWLLALLILILFGWYAYSAGWLNKFTGTSSRDVNTENQNNQGNLNEQQQEEAPISNLTIQTSNGFPVEKTLVVKGQLSGCTYLNEPQVIQDGNTFYVSLTTSKKDDTPCVEDLPSPYESRIALPINGLPAGVYNIVINGKQMTFELAQDNKIDFSVGGEK